MIGKDNFSCLRLFRNILASTEHLRDRQSSAAIFESADVMLISAFVH